MMTTTTTRRGGDAFIRNRSGRAKGTGPNVLCGARARAGRGGGRGGGKEGWYDDDCSPGTAFRRANPGRYRAQSRSMAVGAKEGRRRRKQSREAKSPGRRGARPQKGGGRARVGSLRAPQMRGGGTAHGPIPRDFECHKLQKKVRRLGLEYGRARQRKGDWSPRRI